MVAVVLDVMDSAQVLWHLIVLCALKIQQYRFILRTVNVLKNTMEKDVKFMLEYVQMDVRFVLLEPNVLYVCQTPRLLMIISVSVNRDG